MEELIEMAEDELRLIPKSVVQSLHLFCFDLAMAARMSQLANHLSVRSYKSWKVWELPMEVHEEDRELHEKDARYQEMIDLEPEPLTEVEGGDGEQKQQVPA